MATAHGAWTRDAHGSYALTVKEYVFDGTGSLARTVTLHELITLAEDAQTWSARGAVRCLASTARDCGRWCLPASAHAGRESSRFRKRTGKQCYSGPAIVSTVASVRCVNWLVPSASTMPGRTPPAVEPLEVVAFNPVYIPKSFSPPDYIYENDDARIELQDMNGRHPFYHATSAWTRCRTR